MHLMFKVRHAQMNSRTFLEHIGIVIGFRSVMHILHTFSCSILHML